MCDYGNGVHDSLKGCPDSYTPATDNDAVPAALKTGAGFDG